jgi:hypothetical protein
MTPTQAPPEGLTIRPLAPDTWDAFADLVERHHGIFGGCWCTWFNTLDKDKDKNRTYESNRDLKKRLVEEGRNHAALVMDGDEAIAWAEYGSCEELPNMKHRKDYEATTTQLPDYRITCIFVDRRYRQHGVAALAVDGALDLIAAAGGGLVETYPQDTPGKKTSASFLYNGTRTLFERAGFTYDRPKGIKNCVMFKQVEPVM